MPNDVKDIDKYFQYTKTGAVGKKIEQNNVAKNVTLEMEDGTFKSVGLSSFSRWWKRLDDFVPTQEETEIEEVPKVEELVVEKKESKKETKVKKASAKKNVTKKVTPKKNVSEDTVDIDSLKEFIIDLVESKTGCTVGNLSSDNAKFRPLRVNGKQFCKMMWSKKNVRLYFRCDISSLDDSVLKVNYGLPYLYIAGAFDKSTKELIKKMINQSVKFEIDSMKNRKSKKIKEDM